MHVVEREGGEEDHVGRLDLLAALRIEVGHAGGFLLGGVEIDLEHLRVRAQLEFRLLSASIGKQRRLQRAFAPHLARETFAKSAVRARAQLHAFGILVGLRISWPTAATNG